MVTIVTRAGKGSPLTNTEVDDNFTNLNTGKVETSAVGTIAAQNANNVTITGGSVTGITDLAVADGGTGRSTLTSKNILIGAGTSAVAFLAPGAAGTVVKSDGTDWVAGSVLPSQTGNGGKVLGTNGTVESWGSAITRMASASATGSEIDFTVPTWVQRIDISLANVSLSGTDRVLIRLGTASGVVTTGYVSGAQNNSGGTTSTVGFVLDGLGQAASDDRVGIVTLCRLSATQWVESSVIAKDPSAGASGATNISGGTVDIGADITTVRITRTGTNTFDNGTIGLQYS